ncbi:Gamma-tubulin complex component 6 [Operophtera brumata]|uniref:Gamma-tubulin complex component 6 n=1 Tax=Operophtera brumata TaxID=104452 RepID=A0A0L7LA47_OPEBR|nr:Gamma-tubulin complex component 6 [Operophtera brumata]
MASVTKTNIDDAGVFELLSELCTKTAAKYCSHNRISQNRLASKMRSHSYELILHKTSEDLPSSTGEPIGDLLSYYFVSQQNAKNTAEFRKSLELKRIISSIRRTDFGDSKENRPFSFGLLDEMLPKPPREAFGSPQPYPYFPSYVFELPYSLKQEASLNHHISPTYTEYTVESFDSKSFLPDKEYSQMTRRGELKTFQSPMSLGSLTSHHLSPYSGSATFDFPRLNAPRDILIPGSQCQSPNVKTGAVSVDIWELATQVDKDIPDDIWEVLIATSCREVALWRRTLEGVLSDLSIVSERHFIRHVMYLTIGIETSSFPYSQESNCFYMKDGLVLEGISREHIAGYISGLLLVATEIFAECHSSSAEDINCMPTLLQILNHLEPLKYEIETIASIYKMINGDSQTTLPYGAELMSYLFNEISLYVNCRTKRYWDKGFHITQSVAIPEFLRSMAKFILLCGKSLRLLKLCNPSDPLVVLISSDHPSVRCCASFEELERQQRLLDVYRTRCLFVTGERVTFDQILLKREAERKAFTEMATIRQAETLEKIVADRKRLAQLIIVEKQHSLRVLEAAMAEAKAAKLKAKQQEKRRYELETAGDKATEEVEKKQMHTEWKIKRLQLDQSRMQLLSTEERNLKREKLELEHQKSEEKAMPIESQSKDEIDKDETPNDKAESESEIVTVKTESETSVVMVDVEEKTALQRNTSIAKTSSDVFSTICNVAKSFFGSKSDNKPCDNKKHLDSQGNIIPSEENSNETKTSSEVIGANLESVYDNEQHQKIQHQAYLNKQKVLTQEFGIDNENNKIDAPVIKIDSFDDENNSPFAEARRNKKKASGADYYIEPKAKSKIEPQTDAQKEAVRNKMKVLGVEYNLPAELVPMKEPLNIAQEEAIRNRKKCLGAEHESSVQCSAKRDVAKRAGLTLNLKPYGETSCSLGGTPSASVTPGDLFPGDLGSEKDPDKGYLTSDGFNFMVHDVTADSDNTSEVNAASSPENSPSKTMNFKSKYSLFNILDGSYSLDDFDPFGLKDMNGFSTDYLGRKLDLDMTNSFYTHPAAIMEEVKKKPYSNIFTDHFSSGEDRDIIPSDNIATLTACLQRSVMLPLTYQLEVVNNSILTHFLESEGLLLSDGWRVLEEYLPQSVCEADEDAESSGVAELFDAA